MGGEIRMGNTCKPMAVSFQCMTKSTTNKKIRKNSVMGGKIEVKKERRRNSGRHGFKKSLILLISTQTI